MIKLMGPAAFAVVLLSVPYLGWASDADWEALRQEASSLYEQAKYDRALLIAKRALEIAESKAGAESAEVASSLNDLAQIYRAQAQYALAEPLYVRSLAIREKVLGPDHIEVARSLNNMAELYQDRGQYDQAEPLYQRSLTTWEKAVGPEHSEVSTILNNLGAFYFSQSQFEQAEVFYLRSLAIVERTAGPDHLDVAMLLNNLSVLYREQAKHAQAEPLAKRALGIREKALDPNHPNVAQSLNNLAFIYSAQGRYQQAEPLYKRALAIRERVFGFDHPNVALGLNNLAFLFRAQGRYAEAESLYLRALEIREKALGTKHHDVATSLGSLAALYHSQGQFGKAEPLAQRALAIMEEKLGPDNPDVARSLNNLASIYSAQAQYEQAEPLYMRSLVIWEKSLGGEHPEVARSMGNLAALHVSRGHHKLAEPLFLRSLAIQQSVLGPDHPDAATNLNHLAKLYDSQDRMAQAIDYSRRGFQVVSRRSAAAPEFASSGQAELKSRRRDLAAHIARLYRAQGFALAEESLDAFQLAQASSVGASVAQMAARFAGERGTLAEAIREQQDRAEALVRTERALIRALGQSPAKINPTQVAALREEATTLESALTRLRGEIAARFPEYDALVNPAPIALSEVQKLVRTDEALVLYLTDAAAGTFAWVITRRTFNFFRLEVTEKQIAEHVARLREQLDPVRNPGVQAFDVVAANSLYLQVFAPVESALKGARHVMLVPDGALQSMPFSIMVDRLPNGTRPPSWLIDRFAFSTLPSLSALRALRSFSRATSAKEPFIGFGHPTLQGTSGHPRALTARSLFVPGDAANAASAGRIADVDVIRQAMSLPETAGELYALARTLAAPSASVYLQDRATETNAKRLDLARYRVIAFATHGLVGGEIAGTAEPGLILTPPPTGGSLDDGYLSASEVALLKLNADWVLLSACNTAAPDGTPGAEGLSGLAKAFFYAGARSLLVSNWYVVSDAAVRITTEMLKRHAADPRGGRAEALRLSMQQLRRNPKYSHPLYWAPFIVVGEAGTTSR